MAAAAERGVDVGAVRSDRQRGDGFVDQDGNVATIGHQSEKPSSSGGSPPAGNVIVRRGLLLPLRLVPQLELVALPDEHDVMVEPGVLAQRRRHEDAAGAVHVDVVGVTDEEPLQTRGSRSLNDESAIRRAWIGSHVARGYTSRQRLGSAVRMSVRSAVVGQTPASASRCLAGIASRPLASRASCVTPRKTAGVPAESPSSLSPPRCSCRPKR